MNITKQSALEHLAAYAIVFLLGALLFRAGGNPFDSH